MLKTFSHAGKVKKTIIGMYKPRSKKKQRRTLYFAIVVFKSQESVDKLLADSKYLQGKVNRHAKKQVGFMTNPFLAEQIDSDSEVDADDADRKAARAEMEEGGFTVVEQEVGNPSRKRGRDKYDNVFRGISEEEAAKRFEDKKSRTAPLEYVPNAQKKDQIRQDFYMFQKKLVMKS